MIQKKKILLTSGILSFLIPGLGQAYLCYWGLGIAWYGLGVALWFIYLNVVYNSFWGLMAFIGGITFWWLGGICQTLWLAFRARFITLSFWLLFGFLFIIHCTLLFLGLHSFPLKLYKVPSISMEPTLNADDYFMASNRIHEIERGNIIVFSSPKEETVLYVKRVIGMPGEMIELKNGKVFINNQKLNEIYLVEQNNNRSTVWGQVIAEGINFTIPMDTVFVMGDNRDHSYDSRFFGPVPFSKIKGKAQYILISKKGNLGISLL